MIEQEYAIKTKPVSHGNPQANATIKRIHQVLDNIVRTYNLHETYVDDSNPWIEIPAAAAFVVRYMYHWTKGISPGQLFFGRYIILSINHIPN